MKMTSDHHLLGTPQIAVFVATIIRENDRYLLVQEAKATCHGKWNLPSGHLQPGESIPDGAIRETREETGYLVRLDELCPPIQCVNKHNTLIIFPYTAQIISQPSRPDPNEILAVRKFTYEEIKTMRDDLRFPDLIIDLIDRPEWGRSHPPTSMVEIAERFGEKSTLPATSIHVYQ